MFLKRLCRDLLRSHPDEDHLHVIPTARDESDGLALSSRNAYLTLDGRKVAPTLHQALQAAHRARQGGLTKEEYVRAGIALVEDAKKQAISDGLAVDLRLDYLNSQHPELQSLEGHWLEVDSNCEFYPAAF